MSIKKPRIICLCGSSRFVDLMAIIAWQFERDERVICLTLHLLPSWYTSQSDHQAEFEGVKEKMDELHLRKIDISDEIFVVNHKGYIGESTTGEIKYATQTGKLIRYLEPLEEKNHADSKRP